MSFVPWSITTGVMPYRDFFVFKKISDTGVNESENESESEGVKRVIG